jgi:hypothetical protein
VRSDFCFGIGGKGYDRYHRCDAGCDNAGRC